MNKIILRFIVVKQNKTFEVVFDQRLTFIENFVLLKDIYYININKAYIVDNKKQIALKKDVPLSKFNFKSFKTLYIFQASCYVYCKIQW